MEEKGIGKAGSIVVNLTQTVEVKGLPANTSAQKAELIALICALKLAKGLKINNCLDSINMPS